MADDQGPNGAFVIPESPDREHPEEEDPAVNSSSEEELDLEESTEGRSYNVQKWTDPDPKPKPTPTPAPSGETSRDTVRMNLNNMIVLKSTGENFIQWKVMLPSYLQSLPYAYEVVNKKLKPSGGSAEDQKHYEIGNKNARLLFANTVEPALYTSEFYTDSSKVTADEQWSRLKKRFHCSLTLAA